MDHQEAGRLWEANADAWTTLARAGYDVYRDHLNTPAFLEMLPEINGRRGLDIGCGEGHNTRLLARRGARMTAMDISETFIRHARRAEDDDPLGIDYRVASAVELPFSEGSFDFATGLMSFMDVPETDRVLAEAHRVLRPGGFLQFSISHPCFATPRRKNLRDPQGKTFAFEVGDYFRNLEGDLEEWLFAQAPAAAKRGLRPFQIPRFTRTLSLWVNLLIDTGFQIDQIAEPRPNDATVLACPGLQDAQVVAYFLHVRVVKRPDDSR